jgi:hypothetical protein
VTISGVRDTIEQIKKLIDMKKEASFQKCVEVARLQFENYFNY